MTGGKRKARKSIRKPKWEPEKEISSKKGTYAVGVFLGSGSNGKVYEATATVSNDASIKVGSKYAVKFFFCAQSGKKREIRKSRFVREPEKVIMLQNRVHGVMPIYDRSDKRLKHPWYVMPLAAKVTFEELRLHEKLNYALNLADILYQLHHLDSGYAHRDIKPDNILLFQGKIHIADFGLLWQNNAEEERLTVLGDRIGPVGYMPPELLHITDVDMDYRPADVYMLAKTIWSMIRNNDHGFIGEYKRDEPEIYLDPNSADILTFEPLHCLLDGATRYDRNKRITIEDALRFLQEQIEIAAGVYNSDKIAKYRTREALAQAVLKSWPESTAYYGTNNITRILNAMHDTAKLTASEYGVDRELGIFENVYPVGDSVYVFEVEYGYRNEIRLGFCFDRVILKANETKIMIRTCPLESEPGWQVFNRLDDALTAAEEDMAYIDAAFDLILSI